MTSPRLNTERYYTSLEYLALPDTEEDYELIRGILVEMAQPSIIHGKVISFLSWHLTKFLETKPLGISMVGTAFVLNTLDVYRPDQAFLLANHLDGVDYLDGFPGSPDLAVEVLTKGDVLFTLDEKIEQYLAWGSRLVWVINPRRRTVEVFRPGSLKPAVLDVNEELDGADLMPGFRLKVSRLFE